MLKYDFDDDAPEMFETIRFPQQPVSQDETPTLSEVSLTEPDEGSKNRLDQEDFQQQSAADDGDVPSTARNSSNGKRRRKRGSDGPVSATPENGRIAASALSHEAAIGQVVDLVKKLGTERVRELCDMIDCVSQ